jgi:hypothetical protein
MNSRQRILATLNGELVDHVPLTAWCFGFSPAPYLRWSRDGIERTYWYSLRMEHIHTLPQPWDLQDDFQRALAWQSLGVDDFLDVSVPWSCDSQVSWSDSLHPAGNLDVLPVAERLYATPSGSLRHAVRLTGEEPGPGWVVQPQVVPLFEDYNIPRGFKHLVTQPEDVQAVRYLYTGPDKSAKAWFADRMRQVKAFADVHGAPVQAWSAFGMDGVVWLTGVQNAVLMAVDAPEAFKELVEIVFQADYARTALALQTPGVDLVVQRGWYSSTDFWSPRLFDRFVFPYLKELAALAHQHGKKIAYVMTTGVEKLGLRLAEAGVDLLYFVDPVQDRLSLEWARDNLANRMTLAGGTNALSLASGDRLSASPSANDRIRQEVLHAIETLGPTRRFILHPLDAIFPDTPWEGMEALIEAWKETW